MVWEFCLTGDDFVGINSGTSKARAGMGWRTVSNSDFVNALCPPMATGLVVSAAWDWLRRWEWGSCSMTLRVGSGIKRVSLNGFMNGHNCPAVFLACFGALQAQLRHSLHLLALPSAFFHQLSAPSIPHFQLQYLQEPQYHLPCHCPRQWLSFNASLNGLTCLAQHLPTPFVDLAMIPNDVVKVTSNSDGQSRPNPEIPLFGQFNFRASLEWPKT